MSIALFRCAGGEVVLPNRALLLIDRADGGNLVVNPPRAVWERSELSAAELTQWSFLVAATGRAMIDVLPQLAGGCVNYWEAGNWALNEQSEPIGPKTAPEFRKVHLHLLGRSRTSKNESLKWGESPKFPEFRDRHRWAENFHRLTAEECMAVVTRAEESLMGRYGAEISRPWSRCEGCGYPVVGVCGECAAR